jgi:hypothetical protein
VAANIPVTITYVDPLNSNNKATNVPVANNNTETKTLNIYVPLLPFRLIK